MMQLELEQNMGKNNIADYTSMSLIDIKKRGKSAASFYNNLKGSSVRNIKLT